MSQYITLLGSEEVARAGHNMRDAAETFSRAVSNLDDILCRHRQSMEGLLERFEQAVERAKSP